MWWLLKQLTQDSSLSRPATSSQLQDSWAGLAGSQGHIASRQQPLGFPEMVATSTAPPQQGGREVQSPYLCWLSPGRGWHSLLLLLQWSEKPIGVTCLPAYPFLSRVLQSTYCVPLPIVVNTTVHILYCSFSQGTEPKVWYLLGKHSTAELLPSHVYVYVHYFETGH